MYRHSETNVLLKANVEEAAGCKEVYTVSDMFLTSTSPSVNLQILYRSHHHTPFLPNKTS